MALHLSKELTESIKMVQEGLIQEYIVEDTDLEDLDEAAIPGDLGPFQKAASKQMAGEHSKTTSTDRIKGATAATVELSKAMASGHAVVVHHHDPVSGKKKAVALIHPSSNYGRTEFNVHNTSGEKETTPESRKMHNTGKYVPRLKRYVPPDYHHYEDPNLTKGDAINKAHKLILARTGAPDIKSAVKDHHITFTTISPDSERIKKRKEREKNRPEMQANYRKATDSDKPDKTYSSGYGDTYKSVVKTSSTPAGSMKGITDTAAKKLAKKHLGDKESPQNKAKEIHAKLGAAIESGDHAAVKKHTADLADHVMKHGVGGENPDIESYADSLKDLKSRTFKDYSRDRLKTLRAKHASK